MKIFKIISLCLCFSMFVFATENYNSKTDIKSIKANNLVAKKDNGQTQDSRDVCDETATVAGFGDYNGNGSFDLCYTDGSGFFEFAWDGGCTLLSLIYSEGELDASGYGFTTGLFFFGFAEGQVEDFTLIFDDGTTAVLEGAIAYCGSDCSDAGFGATCFDGGCADSEADCPIEGDCSDVIDPTYGETIADCADSDCVPAAWIGDGYCDGTAQQYGADLCCYDEDGGDCDADGDGISEGCLPPECGDGICNGDETEATCPEDCAPSEGCADCEFDWTDYGSECCDTAWDEFGINCATLEANYGWDCAGCNCPGDAPPECGDGICNGDETYETCPQDCNESGCGNDEVVDCDGTGECWPAGWVGDGFPDCEDQQYGADLTCYDCDGGDCPETDPGCGDADECGDGECTGSETIANCPEDCDPCIDYDVSGDVNNDDSVNVLDIVSVVNHVLGDELSGCELGAADMNSDGIINVLDIVSIVNVILGTGRTTSDATSATMNIDGKDLSISGNGFISAIQMTLSHGSDFSIDLTNDAMVAEYRTENGMTRLVVVVPESDYIFTATGDYVIDEVIVVNGDSTILNVAEPSSFTLSEAYPNPFNPSTSLKLNMPENGYVSVKSYNLAGQVVGVIMEGSIEEGLHTMTWDGSELSSGVYLITAEYAGNVATQKVMLMK